MPAVRRTAAVEAFWKIHRWIYRKTGGRVGSRLQGRRVLLLTTTGRKTGRAHTTALYYLPHDTRYVVIASNAGEPRHPAWFLNLRASPRGIVQDGARRFVVVAREASGEERGRLWARVVQMDPAYGAYQRRATRQIPVVVLEPEPEENL